MTCDFLVEAEALLADHQHERLLVIDARVPKAYQEGHIPGAVNLSTYGCFVPDTTEAGMRHFAQDVAQRYASIGVTHDRQIVVYEDETGMRAARELWILEWLGHKNVRMLHGGLGAWRLAGGELDQQAPALEPSVFEPDIDASIVITASEIREALGTGTHKLIDVRDDSEYRGLDHTECCDRRGHIPGAVWVESTQLLENGRYKPRESIRETLALQGVTDQDELVPYCHRGARSANAYFAFRYAGYPRIRNFIGSMHEWSANHALPIET